VTGNNDARWKLEIERGIFKKNGSGSKPLIKYTAINFESYTF
jgi:hypothetical protein